MILVNMVKMVDDFCKYGKKVGCLVNIAMMIRKREVLVPRIPICGICINFLDPDSYNRSCIFWIRLDMFFFKSVSFIIRIRSNVDSI